MRVIYQRQSVNCLAMNKPSLAQQRSEPSQPGHDTTNSRCEATSKLAIRRTAPAIEKHDYHYLVDYLHLLFSPIFGMG